ncbi:MAG TPA: serine hydrolase domain-containing protein [Acidimicrobiales bacterium]|nr:serine hydrolase domain-containing protein [Acidimicrobiales bacterium]
MPTKRRSSRAQIARDVAEHLARVASEALEYFPAAGGVIAIVDRGGTLAQTTFGVADVERGIAMSTDRLFQIGSISKLFTALIVNQLVDEGLFAFDDSIGRVVEWLPSESGVGQATIEELLTHTGGVVTGGDSLPDDAAEIWNSRNLVTTSRGDRFHYSNLGYLLLGEAVRARSGQLLGDLVRTRWLEPLAMRDALARAGYAQRQDFAPGYWPRRPDRPWVPGDELDRASWFEVDSASGNVSASSADMARLVMALLGAANNDPLLDDGGEPVLTPAMFERMTSTLAPQGEPVYVPDGVEPVSESRYGMGINVERIGGRQLVSHGGGMVGYSTFMLVDCTSEVGLVVLTNANGNVVLSHLLSRVGLADFVQRENGGGSLAPISLATTVREHGALPAEGSGTFYARSDETAIEFVVDASTGLVEVLRGGESGRLYRQPNGRFVSDHPQLRTFCLDLRGDDREPCWLYGAETFGARVSPDEVVRSERPLPHPLVGHYRSYTPWYPEFRIFERENELWLAAPGGVEAPDNDVCLVQVGVDLYRVGSDPWLPERLIVSAARGDEVVALERDGCLYSRVFST